MARVSTRELAQYVLEGRLSRSGCLLARYSLHIARRHHPLFRAAACLRSQSSRSSEIQPPPPPAAYPNLVGTNFSGPTNPWKQIKQNAKAERRAKRKASTPSGQTVPGWELCVGIEIHAQLNTTTKLFSAATAPPAISVATPSSSNPNSHTALFDLATPGSQPVFQPAVLVPAIRAALALGCKIQNESSFDRKHYFWWDQPAGYQITQYYSPFARDGEVVLTSADGIAQEDADTVGGKPLRVGIRQVQLEQDTAKTIAEPGGVGFLDFNRAGVPLIEIITEPCMHHPRTAAAFVRKVQSILRSVDACVSGMESGGLRTDVNVSVRRRVVTTQELEDSAGNSASDDVVDKEPGNSAVGVPCVSVGPSISSGNPPCIGEGLGTRTEIKNLGTIKAIEDAIIAERDRQIRDLEAGLLVHSETRGWTLGGKETYHIRYKEGEVDYRYMPDPDIPPLRICPEVVANIKEAFPTLPESERRCLVDVHGLVDQDATTLMTLDEGCRVEYFYRVMDASAIMCDMDTMSQEEFRRWSGLVAKYIIHELGRLTAQRGSSKLLLAGQGAAPEVTAVEFTPDGQCERIPAASLAQLLILVHEERISAAVAKQLLLELFDKKLESKSITEIIERRGLWFLPLSSGQYDAMVVAVFDEMGGKMADELIKTGGEGKGAGKLQAALGQMMKIGPKASIVPRDAIAAIKRYIVKRNLAQTN